MKSGKEHEGSDTPTFKQEDLNTVYLPVPRKKRKLNVKGTSLFGPTVHKPKRLRTDDHFI